MVTLSVAINLYFVTKGKMIQQVVVHESRDDEVSDEKFSKEMMIFNMENLAKF